uniref:DUF4362 domain-containing protein n=1 Tax=Ascaris lumbricoides TaxID=6252 RepID=A0A0M3IKC4_ASCLU
MRTLSAFLFVIFIIGFVSSYIKEIHSNTTLNITFTSPNTSDGAVCGDQKLAAFIDSAMKYYSHDMGQLSKYILDQIIRAAYPGKYVVHAQMIGSTRQGLDWQTLTNSDIFTRLNRYNCYYHDTQTYILILRIVT